MSINNIRVDVLPLHLSCDPPSYLAYPRYPFSLIFHYESNPNKGELEPDWPSREPSREEVLSTWQGPGPWDPGGPPGERTTEPRGPVEANDKSDVAGIGACKPNKEALVMQTSSQSSSTISSSQTRTLDPFTIIPLHHPELLPLRS